MRGGDPVRLITQKHEAAKGNTNSCLKDICPCWSSLNISLQSMYQPIFTLALAILCLDQNMTQFACLPSVQRSSDLPSSSFLPSNKFCAHKFSLGCLRTARPTIPGTRKIGGSNKNKKEMSFKTFGNNDSKEHL